MSTISDPAAFMSRMLSRSEQLAGARAELPPLKVAGQTATIRFYQSVDDFGGPWGLSAQEFAQRLDELPPEVDTIDLRINSRGGSVFEAVTIANQLRAHPARVVATVEGLAASAASYLAVTADETVMMPNSRMMLHAAWGISIGNAGDMRIMADLLDQLTSDLAASYAAKSGETVDDWMGRLSEDRWYSAEEAVAAGLADRVDPPTASDDTPSSKDAGQAHLGFDPSISLALLNL